jgi:hypothetical protein
MSNSRKMMRIARCGTLAFCACTAAGSPRPLSTPQSAPECSAPPPTASRFRSFTRADFNRRAAELALPLFWRDDANATGAPEPDELVVTWNPSPRRRAEFVDAGGCYSSAFVAAFEKMRAPDDFTGLPAHELERRAAVRRELARGRPTLMESDFSTATAGERALAIHVVRAAARIEALYARQKGTAGLSAQIPPDDPASLALFFRNQGPACRAPQTENDPACHALPARDARVVGLYPAAIQTDPGFCARLEEQPNAVALRDHFSVVAPAVEAQGFESVPYSVAYREEMQAVASELDAAAAELGSDERALAHYLSVSARAFRDNDWESANVAWRAMSESRSKYYLRVGPDEVSVDPCGHKAGFGLTFARIDQTSREWQRELAHVQQTLEDDLAALAGPPYRARRAGFDMPEFIEIILSAGDARIPLGAIGGQSLPNWGPTAEMGGRTIVMTNVQTNPDSLEARREQMAAVYCSETLSRAPIDRELLLLGTVLHEAAHNLGPTLDYTVDGQPDHQIFGAPLAGLLEEFKASTAELYLPRLLVERQRLATERAQSSHVRSLASALAIASEGMYHANGKPRPTAQIAAVQLGTLRRAGALVWKPDELAGNARDRGCLDIRFERWDAAVTRLMQQILQIKARGDRRAAHDWIQLWVEGDAAAKAWRAEIATRWLRTPKASLVYAIGGIDSAL